jgi:valyl-tRNA synthetase
MSGIHFLGVVPFHTIYLHGLVRDEQGRKMSKSLGNVIDPIEVMDEYGTDALRFTLATSSTPGNDMKLAPARIVGNRNFANKIWNAARFVIGQTEAFGGGIPALEAVQPKSLADRWIVSRAQRLTAEVTRLMDDYQFGEAGRQIYDFIWSEYCDWYLEIAKIQLRDEAQAPRTALILRAALDRALRLLHPFMPFVTEEVWQHLYADMSEGERPASALIVAPWPQMDAAAQRQRDDRAEGDMALIQEVVTAIRNARNEADVEAKRRITVILVGGAKTPLLRQQAALVEQLARTEPPSIERRLSAKPEQAMALVAGGVEVYLPLAGLLDLAKEAERLDGEIVKAQAAVERSQKTLENPNFVTRAKPEIVQRERDALAAAQDTLTRLQARRLELAG